MKVFAIFVASLLTLSGMVACSEADAPTTTAQPTTSANVTTTAAIITTTTEGPNTETISFLMAALADILRNSTKILDDSEDPSATLESIIALRYTLGMMAPGNGDADFDAVKAAATHALDEQVLAWERKVEWSTNKGDLDLFNSMAAHSLAAQDEIFAVEQEINALRALIGADPVDFPDVTTTSMTASSTTQKPDDWVSVAQFSGDSKKKTSTFELSGAPARLRYEAVGEYTYLSVFIVPAGTDLSETGGFPEVDISEPGSDVTMLTQDAGTYYLQTIAYGCHWTVTIEEQR